MNQKLESLFSAIMFIHIVYFPYIPVHYARHANQECWRCFDYYVVDVIIGLCTCFICSTMYFWNLIFILCEKGKQGCTFEWVDAEDKQPRKQMRFLFCAEQDRKIK